MEDQIVSDTSSIPISESKLLVGDKRSGEEFGGKSELGRRRVKMRDLEFVFSEGINTHYPTFTENIEGNPYLFSAEKEKSQVANDTKTLNSDVARGEIRRDALPALLDTSSRPLDLNTKVCVANNSAGGDTPACALKLSSSEKHGIEQDANFAASKGFGWDLNAEDVSSSLNRNPFYPFKNLENPRSSYDSECGSSTGPLEEKDSNENVERYEAKWLHLSFPWRHPGSQPKRGFSTLLSESVDFNSDRTGGDGDSSKLERRICENTSSLSNEESANVTTVSSLSIKAANVASQWLELLYQDTKGRLAALQRSKKRVQAVIHTELPSLISQEFPSNQANDQYAMKNSAAGCSDNTDAELHRARWSALFDQMDKALSEEEKQLESWLKPSKRNEAPLRMGPSTWFTTAGNIR
ncbi:cation-transporting ATPase [Actinidia rufa]|uniref:Cation-transporting ATPase n=1 Tax=Actinidia rufa TaxID=165716 RepID=A0A7J0E6C5_9ERIC|nr:cation-transporting ATPase [Actinidia rufa]